MTRYIRASILSGLLFGALDGFINANPLAQRLFGFYGPLARTSVNATAGIVIDLAYGFILAWLFLRLYDALPGGARIAKGVSFALLVWFLRVVMGAVGEWMTLNIPVQAIIYSLLAGLGEMLALGVLYGLLLGPQPVR